jgi:hypothetical protein
MIIFGLICFGIILGSIFERYISVRIEMRNEVHSHKMTNIATQYNLDTQAQSMEFLRGYPEAKEQEEIATNAIGYQYESELEPEEDFDDEENKDCKSKIGFKINN